MSKKNYSVAKVFDSNSRYYDSQCKEHNKLYIKFVMMCCHNLLKNRGYLFLNEVYRQLGFPLTREGQMYGWIHNGITEFDIPYTTKYSNGKDSIYITLECMENILDALPSEKEL